MSARQFADTFAIAQLTPGPNVIIVTLIGYHVAGLPGALVATFAMWGPTCVFAFYVGDAWERFKDAPRAAVQAGPLPNPDRIDRGERLRGGVGGAQSAAVVVVLGTTLLTCVTRLNPLWIFAVAALLGLAGLIEM